MVVKLANNAISTIAASITAAATSLSVQGADAGKFPTLAAGDWHPATIIDAAGNMEIVKVTARAGAVLTIARAQEGTTAKAFAAGSRIDIRLTAGAFAEIANQVLAAVAYSGAYSDLSGKPALGTAAAQNVGYFATAAQGSKADTALQPEDADPWAMQPLGALIAVSMGVTGTVAPPKDKAYRYILLTAGQTGAGAYNQSVLTSESVSGSSPNVSATATVVLAGSPFNGQIVRLINTERRFLRAGSPGTLENSDNLSHAHGVNDGGHNHGVNDPGHSHGLGWLELKTGSPDGRLFPDYLNSGNNTQTRGSGTGIWLNGSGANVSIQASGGSEARPRNIGVDFYMRIK
ncbi:hypothetical protein [Agrobacterium tumefaciens]|uniref:hypothetical protein n=1 Tax=Agrobacterium tumefaciens TaxID=358 RepID=UPI00061878F8|nr:hypothetical protein [Agrobacterium tumefaciens]AKC07177.1 phage tail fiber protein [Agrobacterium tumefaciens]AYM67318.1 hypothetical protein AtA6_11010 [Agrobacterium tumefaciens]NIB54911.1 hypothetical protein [Agrobacterium tumefaciens]NSZ21628.1 hypothetical protein [Agrobacterium tumefaciens]QQE32524.1 hypothetical protein I6I05_11250 [Agrobacterium tumefaciens]